MGFSTPSVGILVHFVHFQCAVPWISVDFRAFRVHFQCVFVLKTQNFRLRRPCSRHLYFSRTYDTQLSFIFCVRMVLPSLRHTRLSSLRHTTFLPPTHTYTDAHTRIVRADTDIHMYIHLPARTCSNIHTYIVHT